MFVSLLGRLLGAVCLLTLLFAWGCRRENPSTFDSNLPPETIIPGAPAESTLSFYQVHIYWYGQDPDGFVDHYEYAVTDTNKAPGEDTPGFDGYFRTTATDSVFKLTADLPQILGHRFYVRAIDNQGKGDPTPAWIYFVAHDINFPNVAWHTSRATWTDRSGNQRSVPIRSNSRGSPTDTVGVGATAEFTWGGFDVDPGGFVTGFEYRSTKDDAFRGGSLADTSITLSFAQPSGSALSSYFTGNERVQVRAIDDAGAKTNPDSVRSFVVGFNPVTWILDAEQPGSLVAKRSFVDDETGLVWPSGTTLADPPATTSGREVKFFYTGVDDPRDMSLDSSNPSGIIGFEFRRLKNGGGLAYRPVPASDWVSHPSPSVFLGDLGVPGSGTINLDSGNYAFLIRSVDELGRKGRADTLFVNVNYAPYFKWIRYVDQNGVQQPLWEKNSTVTVNLTMENGEYPDFHVLYLASDQHFPPPNKDPADSVNVVVEAEPGAVKDYAARLNKSRSGFQAAPGDTLPGETFFQVAPQKSENIIGPGDNTLIMRARDRSDRVREMTVNFKVNLN